MFKKVCIIGCGLIGSSLAKKKKKKNLAEKIVSSNRSDKINKKVIELKIVNDSSSNSKKMVEDSDLIITPLKDKLEIYLNYTVSDSEREMKIVGFGKWKNFENEL